MSRKARRVTDPAVAALAERLSAPRRVDRMRALRALGEHGGPDATRLLFAHADDDTESPVLRNCALDALVVIGTAEVADGLEARLDGFASRRGRRAVEKKVRRIRENLDG